MRTPSLLGLAIGAGLVSSIAHAAPAVIDPQNPPPLPPPTLQERCGTAIVAKQQELVARGIDLGAQVTAIQTVSGTSVTSPAWCFQVFQNGRMHATGDGFAAAIFGSTLAKFTALGAEAGFGRALGEPAPDAAGVTSQVFTAGSIIAHPTFGLRAIYNPLARLWTLDGRQARFGYPTSDQIANPFGLGAYSYLERGYLARTDDLGEWIDFTGAGEGRVSASVTLYRDANFLGTSTSKWLAGESPVALRAQLGTLDNLTSSLAVNLPTRTSLYLYDQSPLDGRFLRITGADGSIIRVSNIGTFMNDRPSSMVLVNHGSVSSRTSLAALTTRIQSSLDAMPTGDLLDDALAAHDATGSLTWTGAPQVSLIPGERLIQLSRRAYLDVDGPYWTDGDGSVDFTVAMRPYVAWIPDATNPGVMRPSVHAWFVEGSAVSLSCDGLACDDRNAELDRLFDRPEVRAMIEDTFNRNFDTQGEALKPLEFLCPGVGVRRVNVLPDALEVVVGDTAAHASCASIAGDQLDFARPVAQITNGGLGSSWPVVLLPPRFDGAFTVVPAWTQIDPPVIKK